MALEILYEEVVKTFKLENEKLFRLLNSGEWREVRIKANHSAGYCNVRWNEKTYRAHRLLYSLYHKCDVDPTLVIDHIEGNKLDNSKENLRLVTHDVNNSNKEVHREGKLLGCHFIQDRGKWRAYITIEDKNFHLGHYASEQQAHDIHSKALAMLKEGASIQQIQGAFDVKTKDKRTSKFKGVSWHKSNDKWQARITTDGKQRHLGLFSTEEEANEAYLRAKEELIDSHNCYEE